MENVITLFLLVLLQAVLGLDNLLYISLESKNAPLDKQQSVRTLGISIAMALRIVLLFILVSVVEKFQSPIFSLIIPDIISSTFSIHSLIVLFGGVFIIYTSIKEIWHMLRLESDLDQQQDGRSTNSILFSIVIMNVVFSFDSILSAMALTDVFWVMATAIVIGGIIMIFLANKVSEFLQKNRLYEVLGLFVLFVVGIMLVTEGGHLAHLELFGNEITPMTKTTFYFVISILIIVDIVQTQYQKRLDKIKLKKQL
jgi:predicted tellurium resistance membrane protein TerC